MLEIAMLVGGPGSSMKKQRGEEPKLDKERERPKMTEVTDTTVDASHTGWF